MKSTTTTKKPRPQDNKAARIPETDLMDALFKLFSEYPFISMKVLRQRTKQPEAYLREVLSKIGRLVKSGPAANNWTLKPEWAATRNANWEALDENSAAVGERIAESDGEGGDDGEDDDEDEDMEDVLD